MLDASDRKMPGTVASTVRQLDFLLFAIEIWLDVTNGWAW
jgi:hypothetical protein